MNFSAVHPEDRVVSPYLIDAWSCVGLADDVETIPSLVATGKSMEASATIVGAGADKTRLTMTIAGAKYLLASGAAGFHQVTAEAQSMAIFAMIRFNTPAVGDPVAQQPMYCGNAGNGWNIEMIVTTGRVLGRFGASSADNAYFTAGSMANDEEHHYGMFYDSGVNKIQVYLDGAFVTEKTLAGNSVPATATALRFGNNAFAAYHDGTTRYAHIYRTPGALPVTSAKLAAWANGHRNQLIPASVFS